MKALVVIATNEAPPKIHDLLRLADKAKLELTEDLAEKFKNFNAFNLEARYPDYKLAFYKLCTPEFTHTQFAQIEEAIQWLKRQFPEKS